MVNIQHANFSGFSINSAIQPLQQLRPEQTIEREYVHNFIRDLMGLNVPEAGQSSSSYAFLTSPIALKNVSAGSSLATEAPTIAEIESGAVMSKGQKGDSVKQLQRLLTKLGFKIGVDGDFGGQTETNLKLFQASFGVEQTGKLGPTTLEVIKNAEEKLSPSLSSIRKNKAYIKEGMTGPVIKKIQELLTKAGFPVQKTGLYGQTTLGLVKKFQESQGLEADGLLGRNTLRALESPNAISGHSTKTGKRLAKTAERVARHMRSTGWCFKGAGSAIYQATGVSLWGRSAYMAANQLEKSPKFKEVKVSSNKLKKLPPGAVVVWNKTRRSPHGHISIALGNGLEASDHVARQMTSLRGYQNHRVFLPMA